MFKKKTIRVEYTCTYLTEFKHRVPEEGSMEFSWYIFKPSNGSMKKQIRKSIEGTDVQFSILQFKPQ